MTLTDDEKLALAAELKRTIAEDRYPLSPRIRTLETILAKVERRPPSPEHPYPHRPPAIGPALL